MASLSSLPCTFSRSIHTAYKLYLLHHPFITSLSTGTVFIQTCLIYSPKSLIKFVPSICNIFKLKYKNKANRMTDRKNRKTNRFDGNIFSSNRERSGHKQQILVISMNINDVSSTQIIMKFHSFIIKVYRNK